jgi:hypothetical protein
MRSVSFTKSPVVGYGVGILFVCPMCESIPLSYKLNFETTNNVVEYEAPVHYCRSHTNL